MQLFRCFFLDYNLQVRGDVLVQLYRHGEFPDGLQRFMQLNLSTIKVEALLFERVGDVARGDRSEQLILLAGTAREIELLRQFLSL